MSVSGGGEISTSPISFVGPDPLYCQRRGSGKGRGSLGVCPASPAGEAGAIVLKISNSKTGAKFKVTLGTESVRISPLNCALENEAGTGNDWTRNVCVKLGAVCSHVCWGGSSVGTQWDLTRLSLTVLHGAR
jgi:hypothetical protein